MEKRIIEALTGLMSVDSPSGFTKSVINQLSGQLAKLGYNPVITNKGSLTVDVKGKDSSKKVGVTAHVDTLGAVVKSVNGSGMIRFAVIGGLQLPTVDGEYCRIYTRDGKVYTGTFLCTSPSSHVYSDAGSAPRDAKHMYIRLDERVKSAADVKNLGIETGDVICLEPKLVVTESGFVKSRFLDDKASVALIVALLAEFKKENIKPQFDTRFLITAFEEVGHGAASMGEGLCEVLAVDMGCVGDDLKCTEYDVSICAQDSSGPYDYDMNSRLIALAKKHNLSYAVDVYPFYGSDVSCMRRAGWEIKGALIGPGVHASHGMERTHMDGLINSYKLLKAYLTEE